MHEAAQSAIDALETLAVTVERSWDAKPLRDGWNQWNVPGVTRAELAAVPRRLAHKLREAAPEEIPEPLLPALKLVPRKTQWLLGDTVPHIFNGNAAGAVPAYLAALDALDATIEPLFDWVHFPDARSMPPAVARRLRALQARMADIEPSFEKLEGQIQRINEATEAAESLPTDLQELRAARDEVARVTQRTTELSGKIDSQHQNATSTLVQLQQHEREAQALVQQCAEAYRITTSTGLAAAFDQRAVRLSRSMWVWVALLLCALGGVGFIAWDRVQALSVELNQPTPRLGVVLVRILIDIFSIAAPVWFAWVATKQVGQRFRLAEDYGFKASVAKAYEGYRREAARIDKDLEARLFASALTRLEEAPLRLVETETHGSPWHELMESPGFQKLLETVPEFRDRLLKSIQVIVERGKNVAGSIAGGDSAAK